MKLLDAHSNVNHELTFAPVALQALQNINVGVITLDRSAKVTFLNREAERLTGFELTIAMGKSVHDVLPVEDPAFGLLVIAALEQRARSDERELKFTSTFVNRDKQCVTIDQTVSPVTDTSGKNNGAIVTFSSAERRIAEESALLRSERLLADFFDNAAVGLHWVARDGTVIRVNQTELELLGYSQDEYVGRHIAEFHADPPVIDDILRRLSCGETLKNYEARLRCKDGSIRHVLISSSVLWENGEFIHTRCFTRDITQQKLAQIALQRSENRKSAVLSAALDAIVTMDHAGNIADFNPAAEKMFGYMSHEAVGRQLADLIIPGRLRQRHREGLAQYLETGVGPVMGKRVKMPGFRKDGSEFPAELSIVHIQGSKPPVFTATIRDISDSEYAHTLQAHFAAIVESSDDGIVGKTLEGIVTSWNKSAERIFGYTAHEMIGQSIIKIIPLERQSEEEIILSKLRRGERVDHYETIRVAKDGRRIHVSLTSSPIRDVDGKIIGASKIVRDVTERKLTQEVLRDARSRLEATLTAAEVGTWIWDLETNRISADKNLANMFGITLSDSVGESLSDYLAAVHSEDRVRFNEAIQQAVKLIDAQYDVDFRLNRADGTTRWLTARGKSQGDVDSKRVQLVGVFIDITERKRVEDALKEADVRKDEFLATLAHEMRNPLSPVLNATKLLSFPNVNPEQRDWAIGVIARQTKHMALLLDDLLDISRITRGQLYLRKEMLDFKTLVAAAVEIVRPEIDAHHHRLTINVPQEPLLIEVDGLRISQVIANLLTNASKYSDNGADITLNVQSVSDELIVSVRDTGIGLRADKLQTIFEMFSQVDSVSERSKGGLGIGLALVRGILQLHGATISAHSEGLGRGSEFVIRLPLSEVKRESKV